MNTAEALNAMADHIHRHGRHIGRQLAHPDTETLDISALAYVVTEGHIPDVFYTDETASIALIESSEPAMAAIRALSAALDSEPCETDGLPDYIEHVSNWALTPEIGQPTMPSALEVIARIRRAAALADAA